MDPRKYYHSQQKHRLHNRSLRSDLVTTNLVTHTGGPLQSQIPQFPISQSPQSSPLQKYASLLLSQKDSYLHKSMLIPRRQHNIGNSLVALQNQRDRQRRDEGKTVGLDLSDRDRYYFGRVGIYDDHELKTRNSMNKFINVQPVSKDKIYGKHTINPHNNKQPYLGYSNFTPKMLNNADQVKNIIFGV